MSGPSPRLWASCATASARTWKTITAVVATDGARIEQRRAEYGPLEHDYRSAAVEDFLWDFATMREEMVWTLRTAGDWAWSHVGSHPYRGDVTLEQLRARGERARPRHDVAHPPHRR